MSKLTHPYFAFRITLIYVVLSGLWIALSDRAVELFVADPQQLTYWQTWKGWLYVVVLATILYVLLRREARWHMQAEATWQAAEAKYRQLFEAIPWPCWVYDAEHLAIQMVNTAALRHYGYTAEEFLMMKMQDLHREEDIPLLLDYHAWIMQRERAAGPSRETVWKQRQKDGTLIDVELTWSWLAERNAFFVLAHDITDHRRAEA
jgi:PAS domain S-box-containing protein